MSTPMSAYASAPSSPRVAMTHADAKPAPYVIRLQQHIAMGRTPAEAMRIIEAADGHTGRLPISQQDHNGGRGIKRGPRTNAIQDGIMANLSTEWQPITSEFCAKIGVLSDCIRNNLKTLVARGVVECKHGGGRNHSMWRLANA